jgi:hypothetical protein
MLLICGSWSWCSGRQKVSGPTVSTKNNIYLLSAPLNEVGKRYRWPSPDSEIDNSQTTLPHCVGRTQSWFCCHCSQFTVHRPVHNCAVPFNILLIQTLTIYGTDGTHRPLKYKRRDVGKGRFPWVTKKRVLSMYYWNVMRQRGREKELWKINGCS